MLLNLAALYFPSPATAATREGRRASASHGPSRARGRPAEYDLIGLTNQTFTVTGPRRLAAAQ